MGKSFHKFRLSDIEKSARRVDEVGTPSWRSRHADLHKSLKGFKVLGVLKVFRGL